MKELSPVINFTGQLSLDQINLVYSTVEEIVDNLDAIALKQLMDGSDNDVNKMMNILLDETCTAMFSVGKHGDKLNTSFDYIDKLAEAFEITLRTASFNYFNLTVLTDFKLSPHVIQWGNSIQLFQLLCVIAARDHGKSYCFSFAYPLWKAYRYSSSRHASFDVQMSKTGMIVTNEYKLAKMFMSMIREEIESNDILRERLFPNINSGWGAEELVTKNGVKITAKSYGSKMRGYHPTWMVVDDFLNENVIYSHTQKMKYIQVFHSVIMNMIRHGGQVNVVGTPFIAGDLYDDLKAKLGWRVFEYPAIFPNGEILDSDRHTFESLMAKRDIIGSTNFSREILVKPISEASSVCPYEKVKISFNDMEKFILVPNVHSHPIRFKHIAVGTDFAFSASAGSDWTSFITVGMDEYERIWLLNVYRAKGLSYNTQMDALRMINVNFKPDIFMIETNGGQRIFYDMAVEMGLPAVPHHTSADKFSLYEGLPALAVLFEQGKMKFPRGNPEAVEITHMIATQLASFTWDVDKGKIVSVAEHDDDAMALWQGVRGLKHVQTNGFNFSLL